MSKQIDVLTIIKFAAERIAHQQGGVFAEDEANLRDARTALAELFAEITSIAYHETLLSDASDRLLVALAKVQP